MGFPDQEPIRVQLRPGQRLEVIGVAPKPLNRTTDIGERLYTFVTDRADDARKAATAREDAEMQLAYLRPETVSRRDRELEDLNLTLHNEGHDGDTVVFALKQYLKTTLHRPEDAVIDKVAGYMADSLGFPPEPPRRQVA